MKMQKQSEKPVPLVNGDSRTRIKVHHTRFYNLAPRGIQCLAICNLTHKLALSRADGSIELWDVQHLPVFEHCIPKTAGNSVEELVWAQGRLFSVGLTSNVIEWDLQKLKPLRTHNVTGNAIWCAAVNHQCTELAVGTEEGYINILDIEHEQLQYKRLFDKQSGRVLTCCYDHSGDFLVTGSLNALRIWNVATGHALHRMQLARERKNEDVIVWCVKILPDFTIVAGDSRGQLTAWEGKTGAQLESHQVLKGGILCLALNDTQNQLVCSGVEPLLRIYTRTKIQREDSEFQRWVKSLQRNVHDHDVKALAADAKGCIYSGGVDGYLGVAYWNRAKPAINKYAPLLLGPCLSLSAQSRLLLMRLHNYIEVWRLGMASAKGVQTNDRKILSVEREPAQLLQMRSQGSEPVVSAAISADGKWLCYANTQSVRLFRFNTNDIKAQVERIQPLPAQLQFATHLEFGSDSQRLFVLNAELGELHIFGLQSEEEGEECIELLQTVDLQQKIKQRIRFLSVSACGKFVAAGSAHSIGVWQETEEQAYFKHYCKLPRYGNAVLTALSLATGAESSPRLFAAFSDAKLYEYDLEALSYVGSACLLSLHGSLQSYAVGSVFVDKKSDDLLYLHNEQFMLVAKMSSSESVTQKRVKGEEKVQQNKLKWDELELKFAQNYEHIVHLGRLSNEELVALCVDPVTLIEQLPAAFAQKKFGVS